MKFLVAFKAILSRDLTITYKKPQLLINPLVFYIIACSLFPLGISTNPQLLKKQAGGILIINAMLAVIIATNNLFKSDKLDGTLDRVLISPYPAAIMIFAKIIAHWMNTGLLLALISPFIAIMLNIPTEIIPAIMLVLAVTTLLLTLISAIGASMTLATTEGTILNALISLPLYIPVLIFSCEAINAIIDQLPYSVYLLWICSMLFVGCCLIPWITVYALKLLD
jgi:heme exporter protein B